ncbi:type IV secretion system protein VirB6 [Ochrobactrum sp. BH3]|nr:type IV secretion system protein VirB6 [Ochrobactrum sp. BH3]
MAVNAFSSMEVVMLEPVERFITEGSGALMGHLAGPLKTAATLYIALYGWFILKGSIQEPAMDFVFKCLKIVIITMLATKAGDYNSYVSTFFFHTVPEEIGTALNISPQPGNPYDTIMTTAVDKGLAMWDVAPWGPSMVFDALMVGIIFVTAAFVCVVGFIVSIYAKMALGLLLVLGPVFIALALFDATRRFTEGWLGQVANFVILQILVVSLGSLMLDTLITLIRSLDGENDVSTAAVTYAAYTLCATYLFYQLPTIASSLAAGGAHLSIGSRGNGLENAAGTAYSAAKWVGGKAAGYAGRGVGKLK